MAHFASLRSNFTSSLGEAILHLKGNGDFAVGCNHENVTSEDTDKFRFRLSGLDSLYNITTRKAVVILSGVPTESKDLRISFIFAVKLVPRSFDSLRSLRMTAALVSFWLYVLTAWLLKPDSLNRNLLFKPDL